MALDEKKKIEINSIARMLDELDYFQILKVGQNASPDDLKTSYFRESRNYHPDKYYNEAPEVMKKVTAIFKRITEAYKILSDSGTRSTYTQSINGADRAKNLRYIHGVQGGMPKEDEGQTQMGKKYYSMAKVALSTDDMKGAKLNLQFALKMEPNNESFKKKLAEVDEAIKAAKKKK